ncbi:hypothetical protein Slin15195_G034610 [Septoria linicola]|uniref:Uncharacterized protein n=1 Tax=Septoria linicola TaxID=215465 RepID=A0A9Q9AQC0_9PEZI|nr:hypothetical protein Slin14017_G033630 [Septoria linicola]USW50142.1 hypothetical protein Slin15195_G034610 [Septoria linicola]
MPEPPTLDLLLESGARLCPWCQFPFIKDGGCDYMSCPKCNKGFALSYAFVLEDGRGRRAQDVADESVNDGERPD